jgi:polysaccharide biosynthesis transport protein
MNVRIEDPCPPSAPTGLNRSEAATRSAGEQSADRETHLVQLARILRRRRRLIVTIAAFGVTLAGFTGLLVAPKYTATAQIVVEPEQPGPIGRREEAPRPTDQSAIDTHVMMLSSRDHLRRVLESLAPSDSAARDMAPPDPLPDLETDNVDHEPALDTNPLTLGELARRVKIWFAAIIDNGSAAGQALNELDRGLKVLQERTSRVISVSFAAKTPERAAAVANRVVGQYVSDQAEKKRAQANLELTALDERAAKLKRQLDDASEKIQVLLLSEPAATAGTGDAGSVPLRALEREAAGSRQAYAGILQRQKDIRDQLEIAKPEVRIFALALPPDRPSSVNPILFIFPMLIASLIAASLLAVVMERLDQGLHNEQDAIDALGFPCIGLVPRLPRSHADQPSSYLLGKPFTPYTEAIRSTFATLQLAEAHPRPRTVLVSSSVPGEGKTTVTVSLSVYAALLGKRVLLVDFDCRHPSAMRMLGAPAKAASSRLENHTLDELIQHIPELKLDYLAVPLSASNPLAPFIDRRVHEFLRQIVQSYDCVFIDSPPLLGITETRLLAALVDSVIFVIKWGTRREVVQNAGDLLRRALPPCSGAGVQGLALVTQVDLKRHADYRFGDVGEAFAKYRKYYFRPSQAA